MVAKMANYTPMHTNFVTFRSLLYLVTPNETSYQHLEEVPDYILGAFPYFAVFIVLESIVLLLQGKSLPRINDSVNSLSHGILTVLHSLVFRPVEFMVYSWIYTNYNVVDLPWNSAVTWFVAFLAVDFFYYWFHRLTHESNVVWAAHQLHHSSEEYNLTTGLRQPLMQKYYCALVYFVMALFVPPAAFYVHLQFNFLYQFWIHTTVIKTLGPLEYILATPSHHRVHHGRNPYCIDRNYGGTLIIWDRIFNTFAQEDDNDEVVYGLVRPNQFWNPLYGQFFHYWNIVKLARDYKELPHKLSAVFKGPSWGPGKPWCGIREHLLKVERPFTKYDSDLPGWASFYVLVHFAVMVLTYTLVKMHDQELTAFTGLLCVAYFVYSISVFGALFDHWRYSSFMEFARCATVVGQLHYFTGPITFELTFTAAAYSFYFLSAILWLGLTLTQYQLHVVQKKVV